MNQNYVNQNYVNQKNVNHRGAWTKFTHFFHGSHFLVHIFIKFTFFPWTSEPWFTFYPCAEKSNETEWKDQFDIHFEVDPSVPRNAIWQDLIILLLCLITYKYLNIVARKQILLRSYKILFLGLFWFHTWYLIEHGNF